jgi:hypothetical protein
VKRSLLVVLIASALLLKAAVGGSDEKHQYQSAYHQSAAKNQPAYISQSPTIIVEPTPIKITQTASATEKQATKQKWYQRPSITDWGVLSVTMVYAFISLRLLRATSKAASAAKQSADTSRQQMNLELRSYIYISKAELVLLHHEKPKIVYTIRNGGKIPATIIGMYEDFKIIKQMQEKAEFGASTKKAFQSLPAAIRLETPPIRGLACLPKTSSK